MAQAAGGRRFAPSGKTPTIAPALRTCHMKAMPVQLKICGLSTEETLDAAIAAGASYVGLVHFAKSPRHVRAERAAELARHARGRAKIALLTVDADAALLADLVHAVKPDVLQLHGSETPEAVERLRAHFGRPVWKAIPVASARDLDAVIHYQVAADRILFDAKPPKHADRPGGNGAAFDWHLLAAEQIGDDFVLSGGLTAANVGAALALLRPAVVDVSSGVESAPGQKDPHRIADFAAALRAASADGLRRAS